MCISIASIINHAFYLLAEGMEGAIGINAAEKIFYQALTVHLVPNSQFIDARLATIQSAIEIYGEDSMQAKKTAEAFDAVEIFDAPPTPADDEATPIKQPDTTIFIRRNPEGETSFHRHNPGTRLEDIETGVLLNPLHVDLKRPSIAHDTAYFINSDNQLCFINTIGGRDDCLDEDNSSNTQFHAVAISPDAEKFALVALDASGTPENKITIIDTSSGQTQAVTLVAPTTDNASTTISHADTMNFTNDGQTLIFDALNEITTADGSRINAWSIYALNLVNKTTTAIVPPVSGFHFQSPSLSNNTDDYLVFDAFNQNTGNQYSHNCQPGHWRATDY